jgi:hypothetical protein
VVDGVQAPLPWHMVNDRVGPVVLESLQVALPVKFQVPVIVGPVSVPVRVSVFPAGTPDCTVNESGPVTMLLVVVTFSEPLAVAPDWKQDVLPPVMNSMLEMFSEPSPFTVNSVTKLRVAASPTPPVSTACQVPLAVVVAVFVVPLPPQPPTIISSARSATNASRFMFTIESWNWSATFTGMHGGNDWMYPAGPSHFVIMPSLLCHRWRRGSRLGGIYMAVYPKVMRLLAPK